MFCAEGNSAGHSESRGEGFDPCWGRVLDDFPAELASKLKAYVTSNKNEAIGCLRQKGIVYAKVQGQEGAKGSSVCLDRQEHEMVPESSETWVVIWERSCSTLEAMVRHWNSA